MTISMTLFRISNKHVIWHLRRSDPTIIYLARERL